MTGSLFGGGGGSSQNTTTTTTKNEYSPEEQAARAQIFSQGGDIYNQQLPGAGIYRGPNVAGFSQPSKQAFDTQMQTAQMALPTAAQGLASANFNLGDARYVGSNPYAADAIRAALEPIVRTHTTSTMPALRLGGMANGTGMSTRQGVAQGLATEALYRTLGNTAGSMASDMYGKGLNAATTTLGYLPGVMSAAQAPAAMMSQVGTTLENQAQQEENVAAARRLQEVNGPWELLQNWGGLIGGMSNPTTSTTQVGDGNRSGLSPLQMGGGLMGLTGLLKGLF